MDEHKPARYGPRWNGETPFLAFRDGDGEQVGAIWYRGGRFSFEGKADKSVENLMHALNGWGENFIPRFEHAELCVHMTTLVEFINRMQVTHSARDHARMEKHLAQARDYISKNYKRWAL